MKCEKCGTPIITGEEYCRICGNKYEKKDDVEVLGATENAQASVIDEVKDEIVNNNVVEEIIPEKTEVMTEVLQQEPVTEFNKEEILIDNENEVTEKKAKSKLSQVDSNVEMIIKKNNFNPLIIVLAILFLASLVLNILLLINNDKEQVNLITTEETKKLVYIDNYKYDIPYDWSYEKKDNIIFSDKTSNWGFSVQIEEMTYNNIKENKTNLYNIIKDADLEITSDYDKKVNNKDNLLFKGKNGNYNAYIIVTKLTDSKIILSKILFKSEVDDILLNKALEVVTSIEESTNTIVSGDFAFDSLKTYISKLDVAKESKAEVKEN